MKLKWQPSIYRDSVVAINYRFDYIIMRWPKHDMLILATVTGTVNVFISDHTHATDRLQSYMMPNLKRLWSLICGLVVFVKTGLFQLIVLSSWRFWMTRDKLDISSYYTPFTFKMIKIAYFFFDITHFLSMMVQTSSLTYFMDTYMYTHCSFLSPWFCAS
jgi:hypothetical protein